MGQPSRCDNGPSVSLSNQRVEAIYATRPGLAPRSVPSVGFPYPPCQGRPTAAVAVTFLREHRLLRKLIRTEPDALLRTLTVDAGPILDFAAEQTMALLQTALYGDARVTAAQRRHQRTVAELHTRVTLSFIVTDVPWVRWCR